MQAKSKSVSLEFRVLLQFKILENENLIRNIPDSKTRLSQMEKIEHILPVGLNP